MADPFELCEGLRDRRLYPNVFRFMLRTDEGRDGISPPRSDIGVTAPPLLALCRLASLRDREGPIGAVIGCGESSRRACMLAALDLRELTLLDRLELTLARFERCPPRELCEPLYEPPRPRRTEPRSVVVEVGGAAVAFRLPFLSSPNQDLNASRRLVRFLLPWFPPLGTSSFGIFAVPILSPDVYVAERPSIRGVGESFRIVCDDVESGTTQGEPTVAGRV